MKMNFKKIKTWAWAMLAATATFLSACNDDDSPFSGSDHAIASFELQQNGTVLKAIISDNSMTINAGVNFSLEGATASVVISENATISPDPATISDWDNTHSFTVTGYNGESKTYSYAVVRTDVVNEGNVVLSNQNEVEDFAARGITKLEGNLVIGSTEGQDSISSLETLSGLKVITSSLIINPTFSGASLSGLDKLEQVGAIEIGAVENLKDAGFPALKSILSGLTITKSKITSLEFPVLENIDSHIDLEDNDSITGIACPRLKTIIGDFILRGSYGNKARLETLELPELEQIYGTLNMQYLPVLNSIDLPSLSRIRDCYVTGSDRLESVSAPSLQAISGELTIYAPGLTTLDFSSLKEIGGDVYLNNLSKLTGLEGLGSLETVGGFFEIEDLTALENLDGLSKLSFVDRLYLYHLESLTSLGGLSSLKEVNTLSISNVPFQSFSELSALQSVQNLFISGSNVETVKEIDVSQLEGLSDLKIQSFDRPVRIKGPDHFDGDFYLEDINISSLEGFKDIAASFTLRFSSRPPEAMAEFNVEKVSGDFTLSAQNFPGLSFPFLESVDGTLTLQGTTNPSLPKLKNAGKLVSQLMFADGGILSFTALETVNGDCTIYTRQYRGYIDEVQMPRLRTVEGILLVGSSDPYYINQTLTNLDGLSSLTSVGGVTLQYNGALTDYSGLKNAISSLNAANWIVSSNAYNPTYQDLLEGKWVMP